MALWMSGIARAQEGDFPTWQVRSGSAEAQTQPQSPRTRRLLPPKHRSGGEEDLWTRWARRNGLAQLAVVVWLSVVAVAGVVFWRLSGRA